MHITAAMQPSMPANKALPRRWRVALWAVAGLALAATAAAYLNPHFIVEMANRAWSCF